MSGKNYTVKVRRKREQKTDYIQRRNLISSGKPKLVVRKMLNNFLVQVIQFHENGDKVIISASTRELVKLGWKAHCGNIPSAYLVGLLAGAKAKKKGVKEAMLDIGLSVSVKGSSMFAAAKGVIDAGVHVPCKPEQFPSQDAIEGRLIENYAKLLLKEDKQKYDRQFSQYLKNGIKPEELGKHFADIKKKALTQ